MKKFSQKKPKVTILVNPLNSEQWFCEDYNTVKTIDNINYVTVYKPENIERTFLMRKDALKVASLGFS
jgi:hypothetical protein